MRLCLPGLERRAKTSRSREALGACSMTGFANNGVSATLKDNRYVFAVVPLSHAHVALPHRRVPSRTDSSPSGLLLRNANTSTRITSVEDPYPYFLSREDRPRPTHFSLRGPGGVRSAPPCLTEAKLSAFSGTGPAQPRLCRLCRGSGPEPGRTARSAQRAKVRGVARYPCACNKGGAELLSARQ